MLHELRTAAVIHATSPERGMENFFRYYKMQSSFSILSVNRAAADTAAVVDCSRRSDSKAQAKN